MILFCFSTSRLIQISFCYILFELHVFVDFLPILNLLYMWYPVNTEAIFTELIQPGEHFIFLLHTFDN